MKLFNKVAIVTGGGQGIGKEICLCLAQHGATVVIGDILEDAMQETVKEIRQKHDEAALAVHLDVTDESSVIRGIQRVQETFGRVDILVNNSGVAGPMGATETLGLDDWRKATAVNVDGVFLMCKHAIPLMRETCNAAGSIVNVSSVSAKRPLIERVSYCSNKAAVIGLTRSLALECGKWGIRVNTVCPGSVDGPRQQLIIQHAASAQGKSYEEVEKIKKSASPLNTFVPPHAVAEVIAFLCSDEAAMMTGQDINVSAGAWMS